MRGRGSNRLPQCIIPILVFTLLLSQFTNLLVSGSIGHIYADDYLHLKNAYVNGSAIATNGSESSYVRVERNDTIEYQIVVNKEIWRTAPPTVGNPVFLSPNPAPAKINMQNGGFESPAMSLAITSYSFPQIDVPAWSVRTHPGYGVPNEITLLKARLNTPNWAGNTVEGSQYAKLGVNNLPPLTSTPSVLYQVFDTEPGACLYYGFNHAPMPVIIGNNTDVMQFSLRPEGETTGGYEINAASSYPGLPNPYTWSYYSGKYVVPAGQTRTELAFQAVSTQSGTLHNGNFIDDVRLFSSSYIEMAVTDDAPASGVDFGDVVTYTINVDNTGESDAAAATIIATMPIGMEFAPGTVLVDGVPTSNYGFDAPSQTLTVYVGSGASPTDGGLLKGDGSKSNDCESACTVSFQTEVTDTLIAEDLHYSFQAQAAYEDRYDPSHDALANYSSVDSIPLVAINAAVVSDVLPTGLSYLSHSAPSGCSFAIDAQACSWSWDELPTGETVVSVTVQVTTEFNTVFINTASVDLQGIGPTPTNSTYHNYATVGVDKNAYINGSLSAENGAIDDYVRVELDDLIKYEIVINNAGIGIPTEPNPAFQPKAALPVKVEFINGSFEMPAIPAGDTLYFYPQNAVPGWSTRPTHEEDVGTYDADIIELQVATAIGPNADQFAPFTPDGGNQYAELNAEVEGTLYQVCDTVPGTKIYYEFYHGARKYYQAPFTNTDVMNFYLRPQGVTTGGLICVCTDKAYRDQPYVWGHYTGSYIVPAGQTKTEFAFESVSTTSGYHSVGNFLDGIRLYSSSYIDLNKSNNAPAAKVEVGDIVTYTIVADNKGESDASYVQLIDKLPAGTAFIAGTVKVDGVNTSYYDYDAGSRVLTINIGSGADADAGGLIKGINSFSLDCQNVHTITFDVEITNVLVAENYKYENQTKVIYEDRYDSERDLLVNYSNVDVIGLVYRCPATLTDLLPDGLAYISHTSPVGSLFSKNGQECSWSWYDLPEGETIVTVTVKVNPVADAIFVNHATIVTDIYSEDTNSTYHFYLGSFVITEKYIDIDGNPLDPPVSDTYTYIDSLNPSYSQALPEIEGYIALGYFVGQYDPLTDSYTPGSLVDIDPVSGDMTVFFIYGTGGTADFGFTKVDQNDQPMDEVSFELYTCTEWDQPSHSHSQTLGLGSCWDYLASGLSGLDGLVQFTGLEPGVYLLAETATHAGYQLPQGQWLVEVAASDLAISISAFSSGSATLPPAFKEGGGSLLLPNYPQLELPYAGVIDIPRFKGLTMFGMECALVYAAAYALMRLPRYLLRRYLSA